MDDTPPPTMNGETPYMPQSETLEEGSLEQLVQNQSTNLLTRCFNEKLRREKEELYLGQLKELIRASINYMTSVLAQNDDKCKTLLGTLNRLKNANKEGVFENEPVVTDDEQTEAVQQSQVSSSKPSIVAKDVVGPLLLEALDGFLFAVSNQGQVIYISESVEKFLGYQPDDLIGKSIYNIIHVGDHVQISNILNSQLRGSRGRCFTCRLLVTPGKNDAGYFASAPTTYQTMQILSMLHPLDLDAASEPVDGTERKICLMCIARRLPARDTVKTMLSVGQFDTKQDIHGKIIACDLSSLTSVDVSESNFIGYNIHDFCHSKDAHIISKHLESAVRLESHSSSVYRFRLTQSHYVFVKSRSKYYKNRQAEGETILSTHSIIRDCDSDRKIEGLASASSMKSILSARSSDFLRSKSNNGVSLSGTETASFNQNQVDEFNQQTEFDINDMLDMINPYSPRNNLVEKSCSCNINSANMPSSIIDTWTNPTSVKRQNCPSPCQSRGVSPGYKNHSPGFSGKRSPGVSSCSPILSSESIGLINNINHSPTESAQNQWNMTSSDSHQPFGDQQSVMARAVPRLGYNGETSQNMASHMSTVASICAPNPLHALQTMEAHAGSSVQMPNLSQAAREQFLQMSHSQRDKLRHFLTSQSSKDAVMKKCENPQLWSRLSKISQEPTSTDDDKAMDGDNIILKQLLSQKDEEGRSRSSDGSSNGSKIDMDKNEAEPKNDNVLLKLLTDERKSERGESSNKKIKKSELLHKLLLQEEEENKNNVESTTNNDEKSESKSSTDCPSSSQSNSADSSWSQPTELDKLLDSSTLTITSKITRIQDTQPGIFQWDQERPRARANKRKSTGEGQVDSTEVVEVHASSSQPTIPIGRGNLLSQLLNARQSKKLPTVKDPTPTGFPQDTFADRIGDPVPLKNTNSSDTNILSNSQRTDWDASDQSFNEDFVRNASYTHLHQFLEHSSNSVSLQSLIIATPLNDSKSDPLLAQIIQQATDLENDIMQSQSSSVQSTTGYQQKDDHDILSQSEQVLNSGHLTQREIDNLLCMSRSSSVQAPPELSEQMAIDAIQQQLMQDDPLTSLQQRPGKIIQKQAISECVVHKPTQQRMTNQKLQIPDSTSSVEAVSPMMDTQQHHQHIQHLCIGQRFAQQEPPVMDGMFKLQQQQQHQQPRVLSTQFATTNQHGVRNTIVQQRQTHIRELQKCKQKQQDIRDHHQQLLMQHQQQLQVFPRLLGSNLPLTIRDRSNKPMSAPSGFPENLLDIMNNTVAPNVSLQPNRAIPGPMYNQCGPNSSGLVSPPGQHMNQFQKQTPVSQAQCGLQQAGQWNIQKSLFEGHILTSQVDYGNLQRLHSLPTSSSGVFLCSEDGDASIKPQQQNIYLPQFRPQRENQSQPSQKVAKLPLTSPNRMDYGQTSISNMPGQYDNTVNQYNNQDFSKFMPGRLPNSRSQYVKQELRNICNARSQTTHATSLTGDLPSSLEDEIPPDLLNQLDELQAEQQFQMQHQQQLSQNSTHNNNLFQQLSQAGLQQHLDPDSALPIKDAAQPITGIGSKKRVRVQIGKDMEDDDSTAQGIFRCQMMSQSSSPNMMNSALLSHHSNSTRQQLSRSPVLSTSRAQMIPLNIDMAVMSQENRMDWQHSGVMTSNSMGSMAQNNQGTVSNNVMNRQNSVITNQQKSLNQTDSGMMNQHHSLMTRQHNFLPMNQQDTIGQNVLMNQQNSVILNQQNSTGMNQLKSVVFDEQNQRNSLSSPQKATMVNQNLLRPSVIGPTMRLMQQKQISQNKFQPNRLHHIQNMATIGSQNAAQQSRNIAWNPMQQTDDGTEPSQDGLFSLSQNKHVPVSEAAAPVETKNSLLQQLLSE